MAKKTAEFLADCFEHYADTHRPYIYGTYGMILTLARLEWCAKTYPTRLSKVRVEYAKKHYIGKRTDDCVGGEKNVAWLPGNDPDADPVYDAKTDWNANTTYEKATVKGPIRTIPKKRGICVHYNGHTGVLTDPVKGIICEFRGFDYGCVRTKLSERGWTHWFEHPLFDYSTKPKEGFCMVELPIIQKGYKGEAAKTVQRLLNCLGYRDQNGKVLEVDGSAGGKTMAALVKFKKAEGLSATEIVDEATWNKLLK